MRILYFAALRERLNKGEEEVTPPTSVVTVSDLMDWLAANDEATALVFERREVIRTAVNARMVNHAAPVRNASVVAFFPPMTGG